VLEDEAGADEAIADDNAAVEAATTIRARFTRMTFAISIE
jgi:hypothetical protein